MPLPLPTIAVVEDDESVRKALSRLLRACGYDAVAFDSGEAFLDAAPKALFDLVLVDIHMPGLTGPEVLSTVRSAGDKTPVILMTADTDPAIRERYPADGFLSKPFTEMRLLQTLEAMTAHAPESPPELTNRNQELPE